jgi:hypothetical protein
MGDVCILDGYFECMHRIRPQGLPVSTNRGREIPPSNSYLGAIEVLFCDLDLIFGHQGRPYTSILLGKLVISCASWCIGSNVRQLWLCPHPELDMSRKYQIDLLSEVIE